MNVLFFLVELLGWTALLALVVYGGVRVDRLGGGIAPVGARAVPQVAPPPAAAPAPETVAAAIAISSRGRGLLGVEFAEPDRFRL